MTTEEHINLDEEQNPVEEDLHDEKDSSVEAEEAVSEESVDDEPGHTQARATVVLGDEEELAAAAEKAAAQEKPAASAQLINRIKALFGRLPNWVPIAGLTLIGVVAIVAIVATLVLPPSLTQDQILSDFDAPSVAAKGLTNSVYASNTGYRLKDEKVVSVSNNGAEARVATVKATFVNESFEVEVSAIID